MQELPKGDRHPLAGEQGRKLKTENVRNIASWAFEIYGPHPFRPGGTIWGGARCGGAAWLLTTALGLCILFSSLGIRCLKLEARPKKKTGKGKLWV